METEWNGRRLEGKKCLDIYTNILVLLEKNNTVCSSCSFSFVWPRLAWPGLVWSRCLRNQAAVVVGGAKKIAWEGLIAGIFCFFLSLLLSFSLTRSLLVSRGHDWVQQRTLPYNFLFSGFSTKMRAKYWQTSWIFNCTRNKLIYCRMNINRVEK